MSISTKVEMYEQSVNALARCVKLEAILREKDDEANADTVAAKASSLGNVAKQLRESIQDDWNQATAAKMTKLKSINSELQQEIAAIKRVIDHAERVVKAIGYVDDVIEIASGLLA
jgi:membrane-bound lytic murein transglycosylase